ncbi:MAG: hypothetical protein H6R04_103 [Burkholderiaceae bacterium]|nr:hypothetical protein [Burkholderiaceae bacterium]
MNEVKAMRWVAFADTECVASGAPREVVTQLKAFIDANPERSVLVMDDETSRPVELDLRGDLAQALARLPAAALEDGAPKSAAPPARQPGRPKLGVVAREITLLPRHWEWLASQSGGASVALRKLVEAAMRASPETDRRRAMQESAYRFMTAVAGNQPDFDEALRALFAPDIKRLAELVSYWPLDVQAQLFRLVGGMVEQKAEQG